MKTPDEILNEFELKNGCILFATDRFDIVIPAMEEYASQFREKPKKTIEERRESFHDKLNYFVAEYTHSMVVQFYEYWTEHGDKDKKMRFEKEKSFDIKKRLERWKRNQKTFNNGNQQQSTKPTTDDAIGTFVSGQIF